MLTKNRRNRNKTYNKAKFDNKKSLILCGLYKMTLIDISSGNRRYFAENGLFPRFIAY